MQIKPSIQKQINQVKIWLSEGLTREEILQKFTKIYKGNTKTIDNRIKEAKKQLPALLDRQTQEIDSNILEREKKARERIKKAYIGIVEFQAGLAEDILKVVSQQVEGKNDLAYLTALKTAQKAGLQLKDLSPMLRLENGLPSVVSKNENENVNFDGGSIIEELEKQKNKLNEET